ncbi:MAG TPA: UbiA family prenyltransferase, partial [Anaerovoracaceae bacterium]|nr:UbiA family prenyltransferase [Anaerovoracaceae bacterium]
IYGAQDVDFDRANGLHSIPERFGVKNALYIARFFHFGALCALVVVGLLAKELGMIYFAGLGVIAALFILEHTIVSPERLTNVKVASYNINQVISIVFLSTGLMDCLI